VVLHAIAARPERLRAIAADRQSVILDREHGSPGTPPFAHDAGDGCARSQTHRERSREAVKHAVSILKPRPGVRCSTCAGTVISDAANPVAVARARRGYHAFTVGDIPKFHGCPAV
jgi:hypothetical protein